MEYTASFFEFIKKHYYDNTDKLRLKYHSRCADGFSYSEAIDQIEERRKSAGKLDALTCNDKFVFPATICAEQATSSEIAAFHASFIPRGSKVLDMTCGLGSDVFAFSDRASSVIAIERDPHYCEVMRYNCGVLNKSNIKVSCGDSTEWIENCEDKFDVIFIDPHRRGSGNSRKFAFSDCVPDVEKLSYSLLEKCGLLMIKASPMLDIDAVSKSIKGCFEIHVVALHGECKEVLVCAGKGGNLRMVNTINILKDKIEKYTVNINESDVYKNIILSDLDDLAQGFIYEPNAAVLKLGSKGHLCSSYKGLKQLNINTHLYFSKDLVKNFPGKIFKISAILKQSDIKSLKNNNINIIARNYGVSAEELSSRLKIKSGTTSFLIAFRAGVGKGKPMMLKCERLFM